jgi:hypothetical protein
MNFFNVKSKTKEINKQGKKKKPADEINEQENEHVDHSKTIREFINLFKPEIFLGRFTNIFNLFNFPFK